MGISGMIFLAVMVIAFFVFVFAIVKSARGWGGLQTTMLSLIVLSSMIFMFCSAVVMDRRLTELREYDKATKENKKLETDFARVQFGSFERPAQEDAALIPLLRKYDRITVDRLRVWRGLQKTNAEMNAATGRFVDLKIVDRSAELNPAGEPAAPATPAAAIESVPARTIVYLFGEASMPVGDRAMFMPRHYLGEYSVETSAGDAVRLVPTLTLTAQQLDALENATRCALYELMPVDSHDAFAEPDTVSDDEIFGHMDPDKIGQYLGLPEKLRTLEATDFEDDEQRLLHAVWRSYVMDGKPAPEGTPPEATWVRVEFLQEYKVGVDGQSQSAQDGGFFDSTGRSIDSRLQRSEEGGEVVFSAGEKRVLHKEPADQLIRDGVAKLIQPIYVRPLNDYRLAYNNIYKSLADLDQKIDLVSRENISVNKTIQISRDLVSTRQLESSQLEKDFNQYNKEVKAVQDEAQQMAADIAAIRKQLVDLMESNRDLHRQLVDVQLGVAKALGGLSQ